MSKIILAQIDTIAGNINYNFEKIKNNIIKAKEKNGDLIIFPLSALFGFPYGDIAKRHTSLLEYQDEKLKELAQLSKDITIILGFLNNKKNAIAILSNGCLLKKIKDIGYFKIQEDTYAIITKNNKKTLEKLKGNTVQHIIHCDTSPSKQNSEYKKNKKITNYIENLKTNYIYVNNVGYNSNYIFEGASRIINSQGDLTARANFFEEDFLITNNLAGEIKIAPNNIEKKTNSISFSLDYQNDLERTYLSTICGIKGYFNKNGFTKAILGLSGGLDSTICAVLLTDALGKENVYGVSMPTKLTSIETKNDTITFAKNLGINYIEHPIINQYNLLKSELEETFEKINTEKYNFSTTFENIQARTRATILWSISNEYKGMLPIATSDKSEAYIGYATINGDMSGGFAPITDITKTKLFALGHFLNEYRPVKNVIPENILIKPPGAELKFDSIKGRTITAEEDNMPYPFLDEIIWLVENKNYGYNQLIKHNFIYEKDNKISNTQKEEWVSKFFNKMGKAVFKWNILPPSILIDANTINTCEYKHPIISKVFIK